MQVNACKHARPLHACMHLDIVDVHLRVKWTRVGKTAKNIIECFLEARAHTNDPPDLCHRSMQYRFHPLATVGHLLLTRSASLIHASSSSSQFSCTSLPQLRSSFFVCVWPTLQCVCCDVCSYRRKRRLMIGSFSVGVKSGAFLQSLAITLTPPPRPLVDGRLSSRL